MLKQEVQGLSLQILQSNLMAATQEEEATALWAWYAVAMAMAALWYYLLATANKKNKNQNLLPPGPPRWPLVGNLLQVGKKPNESLAALSAKYGALMTLQLGRRTTIVVSSADMAREILKTQDHVFAGRTVPHANEALGHSRASIVFRQQVPQWRMFRRVSTTHLFTPKRLQSLQPLRRHKLAQMVAHVLAMSRDREPLDVGQTAMSCSLNLIGNMIFGRDMFEAGSPQLREFRSTSWELLELHAIPNIADFFPLLKPLDPQLIFRRCTKALTRFYAMLDQLIQENLNNTTATGTGLLSDLLDSRDDNTSLTIAAIRAYLADMFVAATDTVSTTVEWAMAEMMKNPEVMQKGKQEMDQVVGRERLVEEGDIENLPYLGAVVKETFRLHPALPLLIPHRADEEAQVCGYHIPRHAQVLINVWAMGRDPGVWTEPQCFRPERFMDSHIDFKGQHFELLPFGSGRRICVGLPLGAKMIHITLARLLQCFDWNVHVAAGSSSKELDMSDRFGLTLQKNKPLLLQPSPCLPLHLYSAP